MTPLPTICFTIASIRESTELECRIYHPEALVHSRRPVSNDIDSRRGAIIAHPYAPLGGSFDDPVVLTTVSALLRRGFVLGTFNFRGAGASKGRTSWTGKAELADYVSFVGFFTHYLQALAPPESHSPASPTSPTCDGHLSPASSPASDVRVMVPPQRTSSLGAEAGRITLIMGGYSYGSRIAAHLPCLSSILARFASPVHGSAEAIVVDQAVALAAQWNAEQLAKALETQAEDSSRRSMHRLRQGGSEEAVGREGQPGKERGVRVSVDLVRKSLERTKARLAKHRPSAHRHEKEEDGMEGRGGGDSPAAGSAGSAAWDVRYLMISPVLPPASSFIIRLDDNGEASHHSEKYRDRKVHIAAKEMPMGEGWWTNPALVVYGDEDGFTSHKKLRHWAEGLKGQEIQHVDMVEVYGAGHFWREKGVEERLRMAIREWILNDQLRTAEPRS